MEKLKCPICDKEYKSLFQHLIFKHNLTAEQIHEEYNDIKLHIDTRKKDQELKCDYCDKICKTKNSLILHIKYKSYYKGRKKWNLNKFKK